MIAVNAQSKPVGVSRTRGGPEVEKYESKRLNEQIKRAHVGRDYVINNLIINDISLTVIKTRLVMNNRRIHVL